MLIGRHVKPRTLAGLPFDAAKVAELGVAPAAHVVTAFRQLHHRATAVAALPALLTAHIEERSGISVVVTVASAMPPPTASLTSFGLAFRTCAVAPADGAIQLDIFRVDPLTAAFGRAVKPVARGVFVVFLVPEEFKLVAEQSFDML